jgi:hypothetical protein
MIEANSKASCVFSVMMGRQSSVTGTTSILSASSISYSYTSYLYPNQSYVNLHLHTVYKLHITLPSSILNLQAMYRYSISFSLSWLFAVTAYVKVNRLPSTCQLVTEPPSISGCQLFFVSVPIGSRLYACFPVFAWRLSIVEKTTFVLFDRQVGRSPLGGRFIDPEQYYPSWERG